MHRVMTSGSPMKIAKCGAKLIKTAALIAVAAMMIAGDAPSVLANDLSTYPCTAGDVEIVGSGIVVNEPCSCTPGSTFNARVQFTVRNNTSTSRYCIAIHLVPDGVVLTSPTDLILKDAGGSSSAPGKSGGDRYHDTIMYADIPNFPCNLGQVCFGDAGVVRGKCSPGVCTTISWNTSPGNANCTLADQTPPGGQCRHQQICIIGFGATLSCTANCNPPCGGSSTLQACVSAAASRGPFTLAVAGSDGSTDSQSAYGDASGNGCVNFTVTPTQSPTTTYTLTVTDKDGCTRTATKSLDVSTIAAAIADPTSGCNGVLRYTGSVVGHQGCNFSWTIDGQALGTFAAGGAADDARVARVSGTSGEYLEFRALDDACHTIAVSASCPSGTQTSCAATASRTVKQCVASPSACP
jgi:hypothetical protein